MAQKIISYSEARAQGLSWYFTGKPCLRGHIAKRWAVNGTCAECVVIKQKADPWYRRHPDRAHAGGKRYYYSPAGQERNKRRVESGEHQIRSKKNYWRDPQHYRDRKKVWYYENRGEAVAYTRQWVKDHPEEARQLSADHMRRRRALKRNAEGNNTLADRVIIIKAQNYLCPYCKTNLRKLKSHEKHVDHIHPLAREGSDDKANIQITCAPCGLLKNVKLPLDFAKEINMPLDTAPRGQTNEQYRASKKRVR